MSVAWAWAAAGSTAGGECGRALVLCTSLTTVAFALAHPRRCNYPGGAALVELHRLHAAAAGGSSTSAAPSVHVDVLAAMTGVSRFGEHAPATNWTYSKQVHAPIQGLCRVHLKQHEGGVV
jgi:hypothetical protein